VGEGGREGLGGGRPPPPRELRTTRDVIRRNAAQDMALAASFDSGELMRRVLGLFDANVRFVPRLMGAEWYLRIRDYLYAPRQVTPGTGPARP
jgi:hypothetical protein